MNNTNLANGILFFTLFTFSYSYILIYKICRRNKSEFKIENPNNLIPENLETKIKGKNNRWLLMLHLMSHKCSLSVVSKCQHGLSFDPFELISFLIKSRSNTDQKGEDLSWKYCYCYYYSHYFDQQPLSFSSLMMMRMMMMKILNANSSDSSEELKEELAWESKSSHVGVLHQEEL